MKNIVIDNNRIRSFDILKLFAIFLVIWGHCIHVFLSTDGSNNAAFRLLNSFHVSLFMMISGYFATNTIKKPLFCFIFKKFKQLLYPCFVWGLIWLLYVYIHQHKSINSELGCIQVFIDLYWYSDFWFLKSCFICYILLYIGAHLRLRLRYWGIITLITSQLITPFFVSFMYPCFLIGYLLKEKLSLRTIIKRHTYLIWGSFILLLLSWDKTAWDLSHGLSLDIINSSPYTIITVAFFRIFRLVIGILGAIAFCSLAFNISNERLRQKWIRKIFYWGGYTLEIYILQSIVLERLLSHYTKFDTVNILTFNIFISPIISLAILFICVILIRLLLESKTIMMILFGRST